MNIIFLRSNPVDPDSRVEKEVGALINAGHKVTIFAWDRSDNYILRKEIKKINNKEVQIYRVGIKAKFGGGIKVNLKPLILFQIEIIKFLSLNKHSYDAIHACDFDTAFISSKCAHLYNKKFVYDIFDYYVDAFNVPKKLTKIIERMDYRIINKADAVIICSEKRKTQIKGSKPKRLEIIHNTPDVSQNNQDLLKLNDTKVKIVYVGILSKGRFIMEVANVIKNSSCFELHIGGFGELEDELRKMSFDSKNIFFYGKLPYEKTLQLEQSCDIITAIYDPNIKNHLYAAPNKFYEALMLGKPLIMVENTGMSDIVKKEDIGEVIEWSEESFKKALDNICSKKLYWNDISKKMKKIYNNKYKWGVMEKRLIRLYSEI